MNKTVYCSLFATNAKDKYLIEEKLKRCYINFPALGSRQLFHSPLLHSDTFYERRRCRLSWPTCQVTQSVSSDQVNGILSALELQYNFKVSLCPITDAYCNLGTIMRLLHALPLHHYQDNGCATLLIAVAIMHQQH